MTDTDWKSQPESFWKQRLTNEQFAICRKKATERPFTGKYYHYKEEGLYHCAGCAQPLFHSKSKYDSGSGWPSFYDVVEKNNIEEKSDTSLASVRTEVLCSRCGSHLGHVFEDGPAPTGKRYCINSLALEHALDRKTED